MSDGRYKGRRFNIIDEQDKDGKTYIKVCYIDGEVAVLDKAKVNLGGENTSKGF